MSLICIVRWAMVNIVNFNFLTFLILIQKMVLLVLYVGNCKAAKYQQILT